MKVSQSREAVILYGFSVIPHRGLHSILGSMGKILAWLKLLMTLQVTRKEQGFYPKCLLVNNGFKLLPRRTIYLVDKQDYKLVRNESKS